MKYKLQIGSVKLDTPLISAPLAGTSDVAYRILCRKAGAGLVCSEMINANALVRKNKSTIRMTQITPDDRPISMQLFGTKIDHIKNAALFLENAAKPEIIDFNFGCPASDIMKQGAGSALLKRPKKMYDIIKALKETVKVPVTAKIRLGVSKSEANYLKTAKLMEEAGADALIVHGRYAAQGYTGTADWEKIKEIKQIVSIPLIGNGDVSSGDQAKYYLDNNYCDGIMIGRASLGNPMIFAECKAALEGKKYVPQNLREKLLMFKEYCAYSVKYDDFVFARAKMHLQFFTKGLPGSTKLRHNISLIKDIEGLNKLIDVYLNQE